MFNFCPICFCEIPNRKDGKIVCVSGKGDVHSFVVYAHNLYINIKYGHQIWTSTFSYFLEEKENIMKLEINLYYNSTGWTGSLIQKTFSSLEELISFIQPYRNFTAPELLFL